MDLFVEILLDVYMELMLLVIPEERVSRRHRIIAKVLAVLAICVVVTLVILGAVLIVDHGKMIGILPIAVAAVISVAQIVLGIVFYKRNHG